MSKYIIEEWFELSEKYFSIYYECYWGMVWFYAIWEISNVIMLLGIEVFNPNHWYVCVISMLIDVMKMITQGWTLPTCLGENICWMQQDLIISCTLLVGEWSKWFASGC